MQNSCGTLLWREGPAGLEVLIVRPSGFAARYGWSIPKGLPEPGESFEEAARRETREETGIEPGPLSLLGHVDYTRSRKRIHCFAGEAPAGATPREEPIFEVDVARFVPLDEARRKLHQDQRAFVDLLEAKLRSPSSP